jgi:hypothetical protein
MANSEGRVTCMLFLLLSHFLLLTEISHTRIKGQCKVNGKIVLCGRKHIRKQDANYTQLNICIGATFLLTVLILSYKKFKVK